MLGFNLNGRVKGSNRFGCVKCGSLNAMSRQANLAVICAVYIPTSA